MPAEVAGRIKPSSSAGDDAPAIAEVPRSRAPDSNEQAIAALSGGAASLLAPGAVMTMQAAPAVEDTPETAPAGTRRDAAPNAEEDAEATTDRPARSRPEDVEAPAVRSELEASRAREAVEAYRAAAFGNQTETAAATSRPDIRDLTV